MDSDTIKGKPLTLSSRPLELKLVRKRRTIDDKSVVAIVEYRTVQSRTDALYEHERNIIDFPNIA